MLLKQRREILIFSSPALLKRMPELTFARSTRNRCRTLWVIDVDVDVVVVVVTVVIVVVVAAAVVVAAQKAIIYSTYYLHIIGQRVHKGQTIQPLFNLVKVFVICNPVFILNNGLRMFNHFCDVIFRWSTCWWCDRRGLKARVRPERMRSRSNPADRSSYAAPHSVIRSRSSRGGGSTEIRWGSSLRTEAQEKVLFFSI